jgi:hypothetical protein
MSFVKYENVPFVLGKVHQETGEAVSDPIPVLATSASFQINTPVDAKKFVDDHKIKLVQEEEDRTFFAFQPVEVLLGESVYMARPIPDSIKVIKDGAKINFRTKELGVGGAPLLKSLYVVGDHYPGEYWIKLQAKSEAVQLSQKEALEGKIEECPKTYVSASPPTGSLNVNFFMDNSNFEEIFNPYGVYDLSYYDMIDETGARGSLEDFIFDNLYLNDFSFSVKPFQPIEATARFSFFGDIKKETSYKNKYSNIVDQSKTLAHAMNSVVTGSEELGLTLPTSFSYSFSVERNAKFECPVGRASDSRDGEYPTRLSKEKMSISSTIEGENLNPFMDINGKIAKFSIDLYDLNYSKTFLIEYGNNGYRKTVEIIARTQTQAEKEFKSLDLGTFDLGTFDDPETYNEIGGDQSQGFFKNFSCEGVIENQNISVSSEGVMSGSISIIEIFR